MSGVSKKIVLTPIGVVKRRSSEGGVKDKSAVCEITVKSGLTSALEGIEEYSHLYVLFWMHKLAEEDRGRRKVHPRGRLDMPLLGVFATRTQYRPNPIGLTVVELLKVDGNVLTVRGLDAYDNTPVLDLKPFDFWDEAKNVKVPDWWRRMEDKRKSLG